MCAASGPARSARRSCKPPCRPASSTKGLATPALLAQVTVAKYVDHQPLYRQEASFGRAGFSIPRSTQAEWIGVIGHQLAPLVQAMREDLLGCRVLHADETPVAMLKPAGKRDGKSHRAYLWSYCTGVWDGINAVIFDFAESRAGHNARRFLGIDEEGRGGWRGTLICDDYAGYKQAMNAGVIEAGCLAHARRKFHELWANHSSTLAGEALKLFGTLYDVEREVKALPGDDRRRIRQCKARPAADLLHAWLIANRQRVPAGTATAKAIDYSLKRWAALTRYIDDAEVAADNQPHREPDPAHRAGKEELAVRRQLARWPTGRSHHEPAAHGAAQRS